MARGFWNWHGSRVLRMHFYHTLLSRTFHVSAETTLERHTIPASAKHGHHLTLGRSRGLFSTPIFRCSRIAGGGQSRIGVPNHRQATRPRCLWRSLDHHSIPSVVGNEGRGGAYSCVSTQKQHFSEPSFKSREATLRHPRYFNPAFQLQLATASSIHRHNFEALRPKANNTTHRRRPRTHISSTDSDLSTAASISPLSWPGSYDIRKHKLSLTISVGSTH